MAARPIRILAIDGGGIRGLVPARILAALEKRAGRRTGDLFDCIAGTSTGGIIAIGMSVRAADGSPAHGADEVVALYRDRGDEIFLGTGDDDTTVELFGLGHAARLRRAGEALAESGQRLTSVLGINPRFEGNARYSPRGLERILVEYLGSSMLHATVPDIVIPSYDLRHREVVVFTTRGARSDPRLDIPLAVVARATSAAPTYFPPIEHAFDGRSRLLIDGGVAMNNPAALAMAEVYAAGAARDREIVVVSIGTGRPLPPNPATVTYDAVKGESWLSVARDIISITIDGSSDGIHRILRDFASSGLGVRYERLQVELPADQMGLDRAHPSNIAALLAAADRLVDEQAALLDELAHVLAT